MTGHRLVSGDVAAFRGRILDIAGVDDLWILGPDHMLGICPVCGGPIGVRFHGTAARADLNCHWGCSDAELADAFDLEVQE